MKITVNDKYSLRNYFERYNRDYYSEDGYDFMLDFYDNDMELDVIGICGDLTEYGDHCGLSFRDFLSDYGSYLDCGGYTYYQMDCLTDDEMDEAIDELVEALNDRTYCQRLSNGDVMVVAF